MVRVDYKDSAPADILIECDPDGIAHYFYSPAMDLVDLKY